MKLRAGTRKSPLAMAQTYMVLDMIKAAFPECDTEIVTSTTKGDRQLDRPLDKIGGKGVFVTEIEQALQSGEIDFAVHRTCLLRWARVWRYREFALVGTIVICL